METVELLKKPLRFSFCPGGALRSAVCAVPELGDLLDGGGLRPLGYGFGPT
jgi:hypothetical protein